MKRYRVLKRFKFLAACSSEKGFYSPENENICGTAHSHPLARHVGQNISV
jgi:hypothetical protein